MVTRYHGIMFTVLLTLIPSCWHPFASQTHCVITEYFATEHAAHLNVDSVAIWHGARGEHWLVATAKTGNTLPVYDATTGAFIKTIGSSGQAQGELMRPNGIAIQDDFLFIVERDNHRLQIFHLPDGNSIGLQDDVMVLPYGIAVYTIEPHAKYMIYVTDNGGPKGPTPKKVHQYEGVYDGTKMHFKLLRTFGDKEGNGLLWKVESIAVDPIYNRLLVADEHKERKNIKVYTLDGIFTGQTIGDGLIASEPEGIAIYEQGDDGYIVATDQDRKHNSFLIFDRKNLHYLCSFIGKNTCNTDGIAITNKALGSCAHGVLYAVHDDGNIHAYDWQKIFDQCLAK